METVNTFENWRQNIQYTLSLDPNFAPFLVEGCQWGKKTKTSPLRGFVDDTDAVPADKRKTAQQKVTMLELMLGQIANYCPVISRNTIIKNSTFFSPYGKPYAYIMVSSQLVPTSSTSLTFTSAQMSGLKTCTNASWPLSRTIYSTQTVLFPTTANQCQRMRNLHPPWKTSLF